jgi:Tfp pilus assembly protein FimV
MQPRRAFGAITLLAVDAAALVSFRPAFGALPGRLSAPHAWLARVGPDGASATLAGCALWLVGAWLGLGLLAALAGGLPGLAGRLAAGVGQVLLPRVAIRLLAGSAGLGVLLAPVAAGAKSMAAPTQGGYGPVAAVSAKSAPAAPGSGYGPGAAAATGGTLPAPSWPTDPAPSPSTAEHGSVPAPVWPTSGPGATAPSSGTSTPSRDAGAPRSGSSRPGSTAPPGGAARTAPVPTRGDSTAPTGSTPARPSPSTEPTGPTHPAPRPVATRPKSGHATTHPPTRGEQPTGNTVTVRPGDSLWLIAARRLGPDPSTVEIAEAWPQWYAANKQLIGSDPDLIRPGQVLHAPAPAHTEEAIP